MCLYRCKWSNIKFDSNVENRADFEENNLWCVAFALQRAGVVAQSSVFLLLKHRRTVAHRRRAYSVILQASSSCIVSGVFFYIYMRCGHCSPLTYNFPFAQPPPPLHPRHDYQLHRGQRSRTVCKY